MNEDTTKLPTAARCPLCGQAQISVVQFDLDGTRLARVRCKACDAQGPAKATATEAILLWNRRGGEDQVALKKRIELLEEANRSLSRDVPSPDTPPAHVAWVSRMFADAVEENGVLRFMLNEIGWPEGGIPAARKRAAQSNAAPAIKPNSPERKAVLDFLEGWAEGAEEGVADKIGADGSYTQDQLDAIAADLRDIVTRIRNGEHRSLNAKQGENAVHHQRHHAGSD